MEREERTKILCRGSWELSKKISEEIKKIYKVEVIDEPNEGLLMLKIREGAKKSLFYIGEALISEAKVYVNGYIGLGIVMGSNFELAYNLALIDGAYKAKVKEIKGWDALLLKEKEAIYKKDLLKESRILETKVNFSTMEVEY